MKTPPKEIEHHYDDCHILIQYNFSVSESELVNICKLIASLFINIAHSLSLSLSLGAKIQWISYSVFFSEIGMEFG